MVTRSSTLFRVLAALILVVVVAGGAYMAFQAGQAQGYALGASGGEGNVINGGSDDAVPFTPRGMMPYRPFYFPFTGLLGLILAVVVISFVFRLIGFVVFGHPYRFHRRWKYGPYPYHPWHCGYPFDEGPYDDAEKGRPTGTPAEGQK